MRAHTSAMTKKPKFQVGDTVEETRTRRFVIKTIGQYYGEPLYFGNDLSDCGVPESELQLAQPTKELTSFIHVRATLKGLSPDKRKEFVSELLDGYCRHCFVGLGENRGRFEVCNCENDE